jgi:mannose-6-phosphate isomerase-like protein (cupin superfamily)
VHHFDLNKHRERWAVLAETKRSQAAMMTIPPGEKEGGRDNVHRGADQWLFVLSGSGSATVDGRSVPIEAGSLLCIEAGEHHEIRAETELVTLNFYAPPEF